MKHSHTYWMKRALVLARKALGQTQPNPIVGAVVLDAQGKKVGQGFHSKAGEAHAEVFALNEAGETAKGGTLYVTLEPCCHRGKTGPCTQRIVEAEISKVVVACLDPNKQVSGKGIEFLKSQNIDVIEGVLKRQAQALNAPFFYWVQNHEAMLTVKAAITKDKIMGQTGNKRLMISHKDCLPSTMKLRAEAGAIVVGANTYMKDKPQLNVRGRYTGRSPLKVVVDLKAETLGLIKERKEDFQSMLLYIDLRFQASAQVQDWISKGGKVLFEEATNSVLKIKTLKEKLGNEAFMQKNFRRGALTSILLEGGPYLIASADTEGCIDRWVLYESDFNFNDLDVSGDPIKLSTEGPFLLPPKSAIRRSTDTVFVY